MLLRFIYVIAYISSLFFVVEQYFIVYLKVFKNTDTRPENPTVSEFRKIARKWEYFGNWMK